MFIFIFGLLCFVVVLCLRVIMFSYYIYIIETQKKVGGVSTTDLNFQMAATAHQPLPTQKWLQLSFTDAKAKIQYGG